METTQEEWDQVAYYRSLLYQTTEEPDPITHEPRLVTGPTPMLQAYEAGRQVYEDASLRYAQLRLGASTGNAAGQVLDFAQNAPRYRQQVQQALAAWVSGGYKNEVEQMEAYIAQVTARPNAATQAPPPAAPTAPPAGPPDTPGNDLPADFTEYAEGI